jgi:cytochrome c553
MKFDDPSLRVNLSLIQTHMGDAQRAFQDGSKPFARFMVQSSLQMCIACHTRVKTHDFAFPEPEMGKASASERADYYFATRQFQKGRELYEEVVEGYPGNKAGFTNLRKAVLALAVYYARVKDDPAGGAEYFRKAAKFEGLPAYQQKELASWAEEFARWSKEKGGEGGGTELQLVSRAKALLRKDDFSLIEAHDRNFHVLRLRASALLHRALEAPGGKSPAKGEALYYLGQIYNRISSVFFFRFGEMYLKACIREYPKTATARSCYASLEQAVHEGYTGTAGTDVPDDEQIELMRLRKLAF